MARALRLSLFDPWTKSFLVPTKILSAVARRRGQGRPDGRRAGRASLDGAEHGRRLQGVGIGIWHGRLACRISAASVAVVVAYAAAAPCLGAERHQTKPSISPIVDEAAARFRLPASWIHAVIRAESNGDPNAVSSKGAMGLMQLMPATWRALSARHALGDDPFDQRANVLAGTAYLRELFDQFGAEGFLAAYNAGPRRYADAREGRRPLPAETITYVAKIERSIVSTPVGKSVISLPSARDWRAANLFANRSGERAETGDPSLFVLMSDRVSP